MTPNKNNNGWILCQSKSFPGKFYNFNQNTGEVTWNLKIKDKEKKIEVSQTKAEPSTSHSYPKSSSSSLTNQITEITPHLTYPQEMSRNLNFYNLSSQVAQQSMFPNYYPNYGSYIPNFMLPMPMQMPMSMPMLMPNTPHKYCKSHNTDQITQTNFEDMSTQTCTSLPLSQFQSINSNFSDLSIPKSNCQNDVSSMKIIDEKNIQSLSNIRKRTSSDTVDSETTLKEDLYKIRKTVEENKNHRDLTQSNNMPLARNIRKTDVQVNSPNETVPLKKHLTISFKEAKFDNLNNSNKAKRQISITDMKESGNLNKRHDCWYIVTDADVLLQGYDFLQEFIANDKSCYLYIPYSVQWDIKTICVGDTQDRERVILARKVTRKLVTPSMQVVLQPETQTNIKIKENVATTIKTTDKIFECCMELLDQRYHVVLLTDNSVLMKKAVSHLRCYSYFEIKKCASLSGVTFKFRRMNVMDDRFINLPKIIYPSNIEKDLNDNIDQSKASYVIETGSIVQKSEREIVFNVENITAAEKMFFETDISGQFFKEDLRNSIEEYLKSFEVKDAVMWHRIVQHIDEWICRYIQIMEEAIYDVVKDDGKMTPLNLLEYVQSILDYADVKIQTVAEKLYNILLPWFVKDTISMNINTEDFMKIIGCSILLLKTFKLLPSPHNESFLKDLEKLLHHIGDPSVDREFIEPPATPAVKKTKTKKNKSKVQRCPSIGENNCTANQPSKVIRTSGKNLSSLKLKLKEPMDFDDKAPYKDNLNDTNHGHTNDGGEKSNVKLIKNVKLIHEYEERLGRNYSLEHLGGSTESDDTSIGDTRTPVNEEQRGKPQEHKNRAKFKIKQKIIRNLKDLDEFKKKFRKIFQEANFLSDFSELSSSSINGVDSSNKSTTDLSDSEKGYNKSEDIKPTSVSCFSKNGERTKDEDGLLKIRDTLTTADSDTTSDSDTSDSDTSDSDTNAPTNDSGFESLQAYSVIKNFLTELSGIFIIIYKFVEFGIEVYRKKNSIKPLSGFQDKVNDVHIYVGNLIRSLKRIINRESKSCSKLSILVKSAGNDVKRDRKITKYRHITTKCMEQAEILERSLRYLLCIIRGDYDMLL